MSKLHEKLSAIQTEFKAQKSRFNSFGKYNYRSAEDILEGLKPMNIKYGVYFTISEDVIPGEIPIIVSTASISDGSDTISATAIVGVDMIQKGMQVPQAFGSASSYGKKYALGNLLLIDDTADADAINTHNKNSTLKLKLSGTDLDKAVEYIKGGGSIDAIKSKYDLSKEIEKQLISL
jgi:hypothetical protein|tara:strand:- start:316 stop:849 length:534 start_codon:yes stop_codon:yes gene_type:complete